MIYLEIMITNQLKEVIQEVSEIQRLSEVQKPETLLIHALLSASI